MVFYAHRRLIERRSLKKEKEKSKTSNEGVKVEEKEVSIAREGRYIYPERQLIREIGRRKNTMDELAQAWSTLGDAPWSSVSAALRAR